MQCGLTVRPLHCGRDTSCLVSSRFIRKRNAHPGNVSNAKHDLITGVSNVQQIFWFSVQVACGIVRSSSVNGVIRFVLPVLRITLCRPQWSRSLVSVCPYVWVYATLICSQRRSLLSCTCCQKFYLYQPKCIWYIDCDISNAKISNARIQLKIYKLNILVNSKVLNLNH